MAQNNVTKNREGYGYKYTDIAQIHEWLEANGLSYFQYVERLEGDDYIYTVPIKDGKELPARRGCRIVDATLKGITNPAQEQGSAITYARRYSLLMAFGLATEDDDAQCLSRPKNDTRSREDSKINPKQKSDILKELNRTGIKPSTLCAIYEVPSLDDIPTSKYEVIMKRFKDTKDKES